MHFQETPQLRRFRKAFSTNWVFWRRRPADHGETVRPADKEIKMAKMRLNTDSAETTDSEVYVN